MASQNRQNLWLSSSKLPFKPKQGLWDFVLLLALDEKPPHFKFDVNRSKPAGVTVQKPLAYIMQMRSFQTFLLGLFSHYISRAIVAAELKVTQHVAHVQDCTLANWQGSLFTGTWVVTLSIWCLRISKMVVSLWLLSIIGKLGRWALLVLLGFGQEALHFKFEVNRLKPWRVMASRPLA